MEVASSIAAIRVAQRTDGYIHTHTNLNTQMKTLLRTHTHTRMDTNKHTTVGPRHVLYCILLLYDK